jgi:hypothetical protein
MARWSSQAGRQYKIDDVLAAPKQTSDHGAGA